MAEPPAPKQVMLTARRNLGLGDIRAVHRPHNALLIHRMRPDGDPEPGQQHARSMSFDDHTSTRTPRGTPDDQNDWSVISIADPDGAGADGAFTDGLVRFSLPELAIWARPSEGDDPGADWLLTHDDRLVALDSWACDLIDGSLTPGDVQRRTFDHGYATVTFRFSPPIAAGDAGVHGLPANRQVIVVRWSLVRRAGPGAPDASSADVRRVQRWHARASVITANWRTQPGWASRAASGAPVILGRAERFGPMTDWVCARIEQVQAAGESVLADFFERIPMVALIQCEHCVQQDLIRFASRSGRGGAAREAINVAHLLMPGLTDDGEEIGADSACAGAEPPKDELGSVAWEVLVQRVQTVLPAAVASDARQAMRARLRASLESLLVAAVVADLAPIRLMARACGAWEWAVHRNRVPGRAWLAPVAARRRTQRMLTGSAGESLLLPLLFSGDDMSWQARLQAAEPDPSLRATYGAGSIDELLRAAGPAPDPGCDIDLISAADRAAGVIIGLKTTACGSARPGWLLTPQQRAQMTRREAQIAEDLASPLLTAIALPTRLHPGSWQSISAPLRRYIPDLPDEPPDAGPLS